MDWSQVEREEAARVAKESGVPVLLVGRHETEIPGVNILERVAITWATDRKEVAKQGHQLIVRMHQIGAEKIILQNAPGQLVAFLCQESRMNGDSGESPFGIVVSVPGERPESVIADEHFSTIEDAERAENLVRIANPRASVDRELGSVEVESTPPMRFEFSHIEWL